MCKEIIEKFNWIVKNPNRQTFDLMKTGVYTHTRAFLLPSLRKLIGLHITSIYITSIRRASISNGRIHFGAIGSAMPIQAERKERERKRQGSEPSESERNKKERVGEGGGRNVGVPRKSRERNNR